MYLKFDLAGPVMNEWVSTIAFKRKILRLWPTTYVDSIEIFDKLPIYNEHVGVIDHPKMYKALGISKEKLEENEYDGLKDVWFVLKPWVTTIFQTIVPEDLAALINQQVELDKLYTANIRYETTRESTRWVGGERLPPTITNAEILSKVSGGYSTLPDNSIVLDDHVLIDGEYPADVTLENIFLFAALADRDEVVFDRTFKVTGREVVETTYMEEYGSYYEDYPSRVFKTSIQIQITYKRKTSALDGVGTYMFTSIEDKVAEIIAYKEAMAAPDDWGMMPEKASKPPTEGIIARQLDNIEQLVNPTTSSDVFYIKEPISSNYGNYLLKGEYYIKVDGVRNLIGREFVKFFGKAFDSEYKKQKVKWYVKAINIVIIFVAFIFAIPTGGGSLVAAAATAATAIAIGIAIQYAFAAFLKYAGNMAGAIYTMNMTTFLGNIGKILGYISLIGGLFKTLTSGFISTIASGLKFTMANAFKIINTVSSWISTGLNLYSDLTAVNYSDQLKDREALLAEQEESMADYTSPKSMALIQQNFDNYEWAEVNAVSDYIPYQMTEGQIELATSKYY